MTRIEHVAAAVALALLGLEQLGCTHGEPRPLTIGLNPWAGYEYLAVAREKGFFTDEGVHVHLVEFSSLTDARRAFERGQLDGLCSTLVEVLVARANSPREPQVVLVPDDSAGADVIVGMRGVRSIADLRGRKVGVEPGTLGAFLVARALAVAGLTPSDVTLVPVDPLEIPALVRGGEIAAFATYAPWTARLVPEFGQVVFSSADIPGEVVDVVSFDRSVIERRGGEVAGVVRAFFRARAFAVADPEAAVAIMARREGIPPEEFARALAGLRLVDAADQGAFLGPTGSLGATAERVRDALAASRQLRAEIALDHLVAGPFGAVTMAEAR